MVMCIANKNQFQNKFWKNYELQVCNDVCFIFIIYYLFANQMLVYNKSSNEIW
jgi:hypothetical protein